MKIAFVTNCLCIRGTSTVIWGYAYFNQKIYNNESIIIIRDTPVTSADVNEETIKWFTSIFPVYCITNDNDIEKFMLENNVDVYYYNTAGYVPETPITTKIPSITHAIFKACYPLGTVYTTISSYLANYYGVSLLPNILLLDNTTDDMKEQLNIPTDAFVYGRYGGYEQFNVPYAAEVVKKVAEEQPNIYFIFMHTKPFLLDSENKYKNIIFLPGTRDLLTKTKFINTCHAMLHARNDGETFGCACGEFALKQKVIVTSIHGDQAHIDILKEKAVVYRDAIEMYNIIKDVDKLKSIDMTTNGYQQYAPNHVMPIFMSFVKQATGKHI